MHSRFSGDGEDALADMVAAAYRAGCRRLAVTEHCNLDFDAAKIDIPPADLDGYAAEFARLKKSYAGKLGMAFGIELGYDRHCGAGYAKILKKYGFEYVINSVHLINGVDCYHGYFDRFGIKQALTNYLRAVRESLDAPYRFDSVGHFGYVTRNAPVGPDGFAAADMSGAAPDLVDDILKTIISRGILLEANSATRSARPPAVPDAKIFRRYRELGGELVVYGSDAHGTSAVLRSRPEVMAWLRDLGFRYHTVISGGRKIQLPIK